MRFLLPVLFLFFNFSSFAENTLSHLISNKIEQSTYIICIDENLSHLTLKALSFDGKVLPLIKDKKVYKSLNFNKKNVDVLNDIRIGGEQNKLSKIASQCTIVFHLEDNNEFWLKNLQSLGFPKEKIIIAPENDFLIEIMPSNSFAITSTSCLAKKDGVIVEISKNPINTESMALEIVKSCFKNPNSKLRKYILDELNITESTNKITPTQQENILKKISNNAFSGEVCCQESLLIGAKQIGKNWVNVLENNNKSKAITYLYGPLFKEPFSDKFIYEMLRSNFKDDQASKIINLANQDLAVLLVQDIIRQKKYHNFGYSNLKDLPFNVKIDPEILKSQFSFSNLSPEQFHPLTNSLSQIFSRNPLRGLKILHDIDQEAFKGSEFFVNNYLEDLAILIKETMLNGNRVFLVGMGSSGKVAVDIATKWRYLWNEHGGHKNFFTKKSLVGITAGGVACLIKAEERFDDSEEEGRRIFSEYTPKADDVVILISASGYSKFNIGVANSAKEFGCRCFYFINSREVPNTTKAIFAKKLATPILVDTGSQAIAGSTRLQAATFAELSLGLMLESVAKSLIFETPISKQENLQIIDKIRKDSLSIYNNLEDILKVINLEAEVLKTNWQNAEKHIGYLTFITDFNSIRDILLDTGEIQSIFFNYNKDNPNDSKIKPYMLSNLPDQDSWRYLIGRTPLPSEIPDLNTISISTDESSRTDSYLKRPKGDGNLVVGVIKTNHGPLYLEQLNVMMRKIKEEKGKTILLSVASEHMLSRKAFYSLIKSCDAAVVVNENIRTPLEIASTVTMKQVLNLISNGVIIKLGKIYGNKMIDISPINIKLLDRAIRTVQAIYASKHPKEPQLDYDLVFYYITRIQQYKRLIPAKEAELMPSPPRLTLAMLEKKLSLEEAIDFCKKTDDIEKIFE